MLFGERDAATVGLAAVCKIVRHGAPVLAGVKRTGFRLWLLLLLLLWSSRVPPLCVLGQPEVALGKAEAFRQCFRARFRLQRMSITRPTEGLIVLSAI